MKRLRQYLRIDFMLLGLAWAFSVVLTYSVSRHPLDQHLASNSAAALISMRSFDAWGFWNLWGAAIFIPHTPEFLGVDITSFYKTQGVYLSYPSLWVDCPYAFYRMAKFFAPHLTLSPELLAGYNLILNRLFGSLATYLLLLELIPYLSSKPVKETVRRLLAFFSTLLWLYSPLCLYYTNYVYGPDQCVLAPLAIFLWLFFRNAFHAPGREWWSHLGLFLLGFYLVGIDWYGALFFVYFLLYHLGSQRSNQVEFRKRALSMIPTFLGAATTLSLYAAQLFHYRSGWTGLYRIFLQRAVLPFRDELGTPVNPMLMLKAYVEHLSLLQPLRLGGFSLLVILATLMILALGIFAIYFRSIREHRDTLRTILILFILPPVVFTLIFREHSFVQDFSALKFLIPLIVIAILIPVTSSEVLIKKLSAHPALYFSLLACILSGYFYLANLPVSVDAISQKDGQPYLELSQLYHAALQPDDLPLLLNHHRGFGAQDNMAWPAFPILWHLNRYFFPRSQIINFVQTNKLNQKVFSRLKPLFILLNPDNEALYNQEKQHPDCQGKWKYFQTEVHHLTVATCRPTLYMFD